MSLIQEYGFFHSQFLVNGLGFNYIDLLCEKIDNSDDAKLNTISGATDGRVNVEFGLIPGCRVGFYEDNIGMDRDAMGRYRHFHRSASHTGNGIGKHGLGGKHADFNFSKN